MSLHIMAEVMPNFASLNSEPVRRLETQSAGVVCALHEEFCQQAQ